MASPGSDTPYVTADDLKPYIDKRILQKLLSDTGKPIVGDPFADTDILPDQIDAACGMLESALLVGAKYTADQLMSLSAMSKKHMYRIIAGLILGGLSDRRGVIRNENAPNQSNWAEKELDKLRKGYRIFSVPDVQDARAGSSARDESFEARVQRRSIVQRNRRYYGVR